MPFPGKHVYLWNGKIKDLKLPMEITKSLDLSKIDCNSEYEIKRYIINKLNIYYRESTNQQILLVINPYLIARYNTGIGVFYDYFVSDRNMVIFVVPSMKQKTLRFPDYVLFNRDMILKYFKKLIDPDNIIKE